MKGDAVPCVAWTRGSWPRSVAEKDWSVGQRSLAPLHHCWLLLLGMCFINSGFLHISSKTVGKEGISSQGAGKPRHSNLVHSLKKLLDLRTLCGGRRDQMVAKHLRTADSVRTSL